MVEQGGFFPSLLSPKSKWDTYSNLLNKEIINPVHLSGKEAASAPEIIPSFKEFMDLFLYHPEWGYYTTEVNIGSDFSTFPEKIGPFFGAILAEQAYRMWQGMLLAGTLRPFERFTFAEFGGGTGVLARGFLDYVNRQANAGKRDWQSFQRQLHYIIYEKSERLRLLQIKNNSAHHLHFKSVRFDARDIEDLPEMKGVVFSNELLDVFSAHKIYLRRNGRHEVAFVLPCISNRLFNKLKDYFGEDDLDLIREINRCNNIFRNRFNFSTSGRKYLSKPGFIALMDFLQSLKDVAPEEYNDILAKIQFQEVYIPIERADPVLHAHILDNQAEYCFSLEQTGKDVILYLSPDAGEFVRGAGSILESGYVITIDYGYSTYDLFRGIETGFPMFRVLNIQDPELAILRAKNQFSNNPYKRLGQVDLTVSVDFTQLALQGVKSGLKVMFYGNQGALIGGAPIDLITEQVTDRNKLLIHAFDKTDTFQVLIQQKTGTDPNYVFPRKRALPLFYNSVESAV